MAELSELLSKASAAHEQAEAERSRLAQELEMEKEARQRDANKVTSIPMELGRPKAGSCCDIHIELYDLS